MTALQIVDEKGLEALSMRQLAARLGTGPMTIYNYVRNREELNALVVEAALTDARRENRVSKNWRDDVRNILEGLWAAICAHPEVFPLMVSHRTSNNVSLQMGEELLEALSRSGRSGADLLFAFRASVSLVVGFAQFNLTKSAVRTRPDDANIKRVQGLSVVTFPRMREIANAAAALEINQEFAGCLDVLLNGLGDAPAAVRIRKRRKQK